jgi:NTE family protein
MDNRELQAFEDYLKAMPLFGDLTDSDLTQLAADAQRIPLEANQPFEVNATPGLFYVVVSGEIALARKGFPDSLVRFGYGSVIASAQSTPSIFLETEVVACRSSMLLAMKWAAVDSLPDNAQRLRDTLIQAMSRTLMGLHIRCVELFKDLSESELLLLADHTEVLSVERGEMIMRQGDAADFFYVVVSGSLQVFRESPSAGQNVELIDLLQEGACVGEMAVLLQETRSASVRAHRDSVLLRISAQCFDQMLHRNAQLTLRLARTLSARLKQTTISTTRKIPIKTIALVPCCEAGAFEEFCRRLEESFEEAGDRITVLRSLSAAGSNKSMMPRLDESAFDYVLCPCDKETTDGRSSEWSRQCVRQADLILCVGVLEDRRSIAISEELHMARSDGTRIELALLRADGAHARRTAAWLDSTEFHAHHHLAIGNVADVSRLVRRLTGRAWGLVLSGGGARGFAHIGAIRALREANVPIDMIAGTSMGAILAAQYAMSSDPIQMLALTRKAYVAATSWADYTFPLVSLHSGSGTLSRLEEIFGDLQIEDLSVPYFCVSCNLTRAMPVVHDRGSVALWTRVSCSVPGLLPPVPWHGDLLVDGGLLNNLPVEAMRERLAGSVVAADVSVAVDLKVDEGLTAESSWSATSQMLRKIGKRPKLPTIMNLLMRSVEVSSVRDSRIAGTPAEIYLDLPVSEYAMTDFEKIDRIVETGYEYTVRRLKDMKN